MTNNDKQIAAGTMVRTQNGQLGFVQTNHGQSVVVVDWAGRLITACHSGYVTVVPNRSIRSLLAVR